MQNAIKTLTVFVCLFACGILWSQQSAPTRENSVAPASRTAASASAPSLIAQSSAQAVVPRMIRFRGVLQNLAGKPVAGPVDVTFSLYTDEASGSPLWFETQTVQADSLGRYTVLLGAMTPAGVPIELFTSGEAHWLGVQVSNLPEQPRALLVSVPYAMKAGDAETLGGKPASAFMLASQAGTETSAATAAGTLSGLVQASALTSPIGSPTPQAVTMTANYIPVFTDTLGGHGDSVIYQLGARIGVGTTTPSFGLDLNANVFAIGPTVAKPGAGGTMRFRDDSATVRWAFGVPGSVGATDFFLSNTANGHAPFYVQAAAASYSLYLHANGNVGVGTTTPAQKLDVAGNIRSSGTVTGTQLVSTVATGTPPLSVTSTTQVPNLNVALLGGLGPSAFAPAGSYAVTGVNSFTATQTVSSGDVSLSAGNLDLPATSSAGTAGVITLGGAPFAHSFGGLSNTFVGGNAGNFTMTGNQNTAAGANSLSSNASGIGNTAIGSYNLNQNTTGQYNTTVGYNALYANTTAGYNTAVGVWALGNNCYFVVGDCAGQYNTAVGASAGVTTISADANVSGAYNTFIGSNSGSATSVQLVNATAIGANAVVGQSNALVLGSINGVNGATAGVNVGIGTATPDHALDVVGDINASGDVNATSFTGDGSGLTDIAAATAATASGLSCTGCVGNTELGVNYAASASKGGNASNALLLNGLASSAFQPAGTYASLGANTFTNTQTLSSGDLAVSAGSVTLPETSSTVGAIKIGSTRFLHACCGAAKFNTFVGNSAGNSTMTANSNTAVGALAMNNATSGNENTAVGSFALQLDTSGNENTATGSAVLYNNTTGSWNTGTGYYALHNNIDGHDNTGVGNWALMDNCSGTSSGCTASYNSALGSKAGQSGTAANANKTGDHNTFLGALSGPGSTTQLTNATAIGANAIVSRDNALVLGSIGGLNGAKGSVNVGIGTHNPTTTLQVAGGDMSTATAGKGLIVRSPDGTKCARIGIDNSGVLVASAITCP